MSQDTSRISYTPAVCAVWQTPCIGWQASTPAPGEDTIRYTTHNISSTVSFRFNGLHRTASERDLTPAGTALYFATAAPLSAYYHFGIDGPGYEAYFSYLRPSDTVKGFVVWSQTGLDPSATHVFSGSLSVGSSFSVSAFMCVAMMRPS